MELTKDKCKHDRYSWSKLLNEGICLDCMMRLTQYPSSQPSEHNPPEPLNVKGATAEEINPERILMRNIIEASGGDFSLIEDEIVAVQNDPAHKVVIKAMREYGQQESNKVINEAKAFLINKYSTSFVRLIHILVDLEKLKS